MKKPIEENHGFEDLASEREERKNRFLTLRTALILFILEKLFLIMLIGAGLILAIYYLC